MSWLTLEVRTAPEARERVGAWLVEQTGQAVEERTDGALVAFAESAGDADRLEAGLRALPGTAVSVARAPLAEVDWTTKWRDGIGPRTFGRLVVLPSWLDRPPHDGPVLVLDPESAFGSGEHGSTRAALTLLERHFRPGMRFLDLGSGSGILTIAAALLGARHAIGIDVDSEATPVAERNAARNGVTDRVLFLENDAAILAPVSGPAEVVCSNILRVVNVALLPEIRGALAPGGLAIFSGMEEAEAPLFRPELTAAGFTVVDEVVDAGWWGVAARVA